MIEVDNEWSYTSVPPYVSMTWTETAFSFLKTSICIFKQFRNFPTIVVFKVMFLTIQIFWNVTARSNVK